MKTLRGLCARFQLQSQSEIRLWFIYNKNKTVYYNAEETMCKLCNGNYKGTLVYHDDILAVYAVL